MSMLIGLTGGIGSGKSTVAKMFEELGATVVDTDAISHDLTRPGGAAIPAIRAEFGDDCISADGALDRPHMRKLVFSDATARRRLEAILHPMIRERMLAGANAAATPYSLLVVPLLFEAGNYLELVQRILVVDCAEETQVLRAMQRSGLEEQEVRAIMAQQIPRAERVRRANDVIHNDGDLDELHKQVFQLHQRYTGLFTESG